MKPGDAGTQTIALSIILLTIGTAGADIVHRGWLPLSDIRASLFAPGWGSLIPLAGAIVLAALRKHVAAGLAALAAIALAARDALLAAAATLGDFDPAARLPLAVASALLAAGVLMHASPLKVEHRIVAVVSPVLLSCAICLTLAFVVLLVYSSWRNPGEILAASAACAALDWIWFRHVLRISELPVPLALRKLAIPIAFAGCAGIATAVALIVRIPGLRVSQLTAWIVCFAVVAISTAIALIASLVLGNRAFILQASNAKQQRILQRQRRIMHDRATRLRQSREHFKTLFVDVPTPVALTASDGSVKAANPALIDLLGCESESQLKSMNISRFYSNPLDREALVASWTTAGTDIHQGEVEMRRLDGERRVVLYAIRSVRRPDGGIDYLQGTMTDITDLRVSEANRQKLEASLRLSQKLESVGRLAAGIAHEINTPMQYIGDNVYFLEYAFEQLTAELASRGQDRHANRAGGGVSSASVAAELDATVREVPGALARTREGIATVSHIVAAMKELAHPGQGAKASVDVNAIIDTVLTVTKNAYKTVAKVTTNLASLPPIPAYKNELSQVLINLIVNAAQAIESRGIFGEITVATVDCGSYVAIRVEDNGCGIPQAAIDKIFDPFFTTKAIGHGTGQGLSIARAIVVDKHDGDIAVESTPGVGTVFVIKLPVHASEPEASEFAKEKLS